VPLGATVVSEGPRTSDRAADPRDVVLAWQRPLSSGIRCGGAARERRVL